MKKLLLFIFAAISMHAQSQSFYFPKAAYTDSSALNKCIASLAKEVTAVYKNPDHESFLDNLFRFQMAALQYQEAINTLDSLRSLSKAADSVSIKGVGFQFETFAVAKMRQASRLVSFTDAYNTVFSRLYNALPEPAALVASGYFDTDLKSLHDKLDKLLNEQKSKDSITLQDAAILCRTYNSYNVYSQVMPLAKPLLTALDNKMFFIEDSVLITTRDGSLLAATVVRRKDAPARQPAIFVFNIYNSPRDKSEAKEAAMKGYAGIVANTRGKRLSPQEIEPFEHDANDAYDIIDWISKQTWSNGKVGMFGGSYLGFSQWAAAKHVHPALKTIIPQVAVGIGVDYPMANNVFMSYMLRWIHYVTNSKQTDQAEFNDDKRWDALFTKWYVSGRSFRSLDTLDGRPNKIFQRWLMHPAHDAYWQQMVAYQNDFSNINIPVLTTTGYYDDDQLGAMYYFKQHHLYNKKANHYLLIGPYDHGGAQSMASSELQGYKIDSVANISITRLAYQWFNYILKDSSRPALLKDKINYQVMGTNEWRHAPTLAAMNNDTISLYLNNTRLAQHYRLDTRPPLNPEFIRQEIDFRDRSDSAFRPSANIIDSSIDLSNSLSFITPPFDKPFEINGAFTGELKAAVNKKDMDVTVTLYELMPDGKYFFLANYITRASYTKNRSKRQLLQPGAIEHIAVNNAFFTSKKINKGSRLAIVLGIIKNSSWQINYGTGKDVSDETIQDAAIPLSIKWYTDSVIKIPVHR